MLSRSSGKIKVKKWKKGGEKPQPNKKLKPTLSELHDLGKKSAAAAQQQEGNACCSGIVGTWTALSL